MELKQTAWNKISFSAPAEWVPEQIAPDYLLLAQAARPVLEVRWTRGKRIAGPGRAFEILKRRQEKSLRRRLVETPLPEAWEAALGARFKAIGFSWRQDAAAGRGVVLECRECRTITLLQFLGSAGAAAFPVAGDLLTSFTDHPAGETIPWAMFDIRAEVPREFALQRHLFQPGYFELAFDAAGRKLRFFRWGPASILLERCSLDQFGEARVSFPFARSRRRPLTSAAGWEWEAGGGSSLFKRRFFGGARRRRLRLWEVPSRNRILGILAEGKEDLVPAVMETVYSRYEIR